MGYETRDLVPEHSHESKQSGYVVSERYRLAFEDHDETLEAGDGYTIPGGAPHHRYSTYPWTRAVASSPSRRFPRLEPPCSR